MQTLHACEGSHFVRCIKPNPGLLPRKLHGESVTSQLRMSGMLDAVTLIQAGCLLLLLHSKHLLHLLHLLHSLLALLALITPTGGLPDAHPVRSHPRELRRSDARGGALVSIAMVSTEVY